jgi:multiple sugar transport system permease protein
MSGGRGLGYAFVAPTLAFLVLFNVYPLLYNVVLSFTDAKMSGGGWEWLGGTNYGRVFADNHPEYARALRTTGLFVACAVSIELLLGFALALALKRPFRGKTAVLTLLLAPMMLSPAVMGLYWTLILNSDYGILDQALGALGLPQPRWLVDANWTPGWKFIAIVLVDVWMWTPFMMLIALAGLNAIPPHLYEAAEIDRASAWTVFRRITLPMCAPLLILAVLLRATDALKQFDLVMAMTGPNEDTTQTVSALLYQVEFQRGKVGLGSAYACVVLVVVIALATVFTRYLDWLARRQGRSA